MPVRASMLFEVTSVDDGAGEQSSSELFHDSLIWQPKSVVVDKSRARNCALRSELLAGVAVAVASR